MSAFSDGVATNVQAVLNMAWDVRTGSVVPESSTVKLGGGAVKVSGTWLYADLADSSTAAHKLKKEVTGKLVRSYLDAAGRIIRRFDGEIRSFDGDRVMGVFMGTDMNFRAIKAGLGINWAVDNVLQPNLKAIWPTLGDFWTLDHGVGIDTGDALIVRGGVRDNNDLISVGAAPNVAAKLSSLRSTHDVYITERVYSDATAAGQIGSNGENMWTWYTAQTIGGTTYKVLASAWRWTP